MGNKATYGTNQLQGFDDLIISHLGIGTQLDGFAHVALNGRHYNGAETADVIRPDGAIRYGIHTLPPIVGRGVLLDMTVPESDGMPSATHFNRREIQAAMARQRVEIRKGDIVLLHTVHLSAVEGDYTQDLTAVRGLGVEGATFLADRGVVAIGMDAWIPDAMPAENPKEFLPVHGLLLVKRGVYKPWRESSNEERLDGENGFLLTPTIDHLFDRGFISFENTGRLLISPAAHRPSLDRMGLKEGERIDVGSFSAGQRQHLEFHRDRVFLEARVRHR